ncbi:hypothetical protein ACT6QG_10950 [Xanthobacter sp. TB0136]|uniref:hypothetical protein n=1 Tax=Xanthobacter sp. TB0136 TaxID=3459177 RepID=UPI0040391F3F
MRILLGVMIIVALAGWVAFAYALCLGDAEKAFDYVLWALMFTTFSWLSIREAA